MKLTLMIEGSAAALAHILAALPAGASVVGDSPPASPLMPEQLAAVGIMAPGAIPMPSGDDDDTNDAPNANPPAFDVTGMPWDARIHSEKMTTNKDQTWKKRRNGPTGAELAAIEAELRARHPSPVPPATVQPVAAPIPAPQPIAAPVMQPAPVMAPQPIAAPVMQPAPVPQPIAMAAPVQAAPLQEQVNTAMSADTLDFAGFLNHINLQGQKVDAAGTPLIHAEYLAQVAKRVSDAFVAAGHPAINAITDIAGNPQMITYTVQLIQADGRW